MNKEHELVAEAIKARVDAAKGRGHRSASVVLSELSVLAWDLAGRFRSLNPTFPRMDFIKACGFKL